MIACLACALLAACTDSRGGPIKYADMGEPDAPSLNVLENDYRISPLDKVAVKVFRAEDLSGEYEVDLMGNISLPLIGDVKAAGRTPAELDESVTAMLGAKYLENPDVSVAIKESSGRVLTVEGAVAAPGTYPILRPVTLVQAIAMAKGAREDANIRRVAVFRTIGGERQAAAFDLRSIRRGEDPDPKIYPGDIVIVDGSRIKELQKSIMTNLSIFNVFRPF